MDTPSRAAFGALQRAFTEGNSELLREQAKETKAVVDLKKPSLPSFSSVEFLVRLRLVFFRVVSCLPAVVMRRLGVSWAGSLPGTGTQFTEGKRRETKVSLGMVDLSLRSLGYLLFKIFRG